MKPKRKPIIEHAELRKAHENWCAYHGIPEWEDSDSVRGFRVEFMTFIDCHQTELAWVEPSSSTNYWIYVPTEKAAQYIKALSSPHWYALLKAHYARSDVDQNH